MPVADDKIVGGTITAAHINAIAALLNTVESAVDELDTEKLSEAAASAAYVTRAQVQSASVGTSQSTTSTGFADLVTVGPAVTVTIGASGLALVTLTGLLGNDNVGAYAIMSVSAAGLAASDDTALWIKAATTASDALGASYTFLASGLTPGSVTFTAKYRASAGTAFFANRRLTVIPL